MNHAHLFDKLWKTTDFAKQLSGEGYIGLETNNEPPHITLINSEVIAKIEEEFDIKYGKARGQELSKKFFEEILSLINEKVKRQGSFEFTGLSSTYSEDHSQFGTVVAANVIFPYIEEALQSFIKRVREELGIEIGDKVKPKHSYHLTIAVEYRQPNPHISGQLVEDVINKTGKYMEPLKAHWEQFLKV